MMTSKLRRGRLAGLTLLALSLALGLAATADAGEVEGKLEIPEGMEDPASPEKQLSGYWEQWNGFVDPDPQGFEASRQLAVVLTGPTTDKNPAGCGYALRGGALDPSTLVTRVGSTMRIKNTDGCVHELYAKGLEAFSALPTAPGNARTLSVEQAGDWTVRDRRYPHVRGHLHVLPDLVACAEVTEDQKFRFSEVAPGTYTLHVFHGDQELTTKKVEVDQRGDVAVGNVKLSPANN